MLAGHSVSSRQVRKLIHLLSHLYVLFVFVLPLLGPILTQTFKLVDLTIYSQVYVILFSRKLGGDIKVM